ncbi:polyketide cyclase [Pseudoxanthomonas kalamensis DSM 18571]|uniref:polyketide cyclase n=1 Tax=Pseudoxanthomonas kalamensis TaxID=289483 RepID=UPI001390FAA7|nr:polyketide cyclase [Pseudoxanthomonas kalamensis]KAF1709364.1 polyketide cyclase [Pseudoxanthomonas kalamensis DSM 18571]
MTRLLEILIALALVLVLFLLVGLVLPSKRHLVESVESNRKMTIVYDTVNNVRRLKDWNQMLPRNPAELNYSGGDESNSGVGARVDFASNSYKNWHKGSWTITESEAPQIAGDPGKVVYAIEDGSKGKNKHTTFTLEPTGKNNRNVKITQAYDVSYGFDLIGRYMGMYVSRNIGDVMKSSLSRLTTLLATVPNFDYRIEGSRLVELKIVNLPDIDMLFVNAGNIERNNEAIKASIKSNQEWIKRAMEANGLEAAGPLRIVTTDFGVERYAFDVAQPVRKKGAAQPEGGLGVAGSSEPLKLDLKGTPVEYVHIAAHPSAHAKYTGYMAELDVVRNSLRAWALTNGYEVTDRPFESWKSGVDGSFTADGEFEVFWAVKQ